jgi:hypothetical protein
MTAFFADEIAIFISFGVNVVVLTVCTLVNALRKGGGQYDVISSMCEFCPCIYSAVQAVTPIRRY